MRVSVTLFVPSLIPTGRTVTFLCELGQFLILPVPPFIWSRAPRWPLSCYLMYLCDSCMFFHYILLRVSFFRSFFLVHLFPFLSPYIESIWSFKLKDLALHDTYFELFIESSKTDQFREGAVVHIVKSGTDFFPGVI